ncbi:hypothetical protein PGT21_009095 [Puccinia graminis f. sp. tritici]|uniref:Uncharacterized protein n=1 Tax=Puccinia graminis f. sp. tritici TaxID=56615 RepID=A0A5B0P5E3_PUCGR|nr:hypothetical protein PGT21_009095 [Puccinia graminis f. sp. tritici]KAA1099101.1 hypothetical protein PGTUg99_018629 [Puccinia graminis f. sp. tritici]
MRSALAIVLLSLTLFRGSSATDPKKCRVPECACPCDDHSEISSPKAAAHNKGQFYITCVSPKPGVKCWGDCKPSKSKRNLNPFNLA